MPCSRSVVTVLEGSFVRYCPAQSRHDSGVGACLVEPGLYLSILFFYFALAFISPCSCFYFFGHSLFSLPGLVDSSLFFLFGHVSPCSAWPVLRSGLAALCLVSQLSVWSRGAVLRRLGQRRCECNSNLFQGRSCTPVPTSTASPRSRHRGTLRLPVIDLAPRGEDGMLVASVEETESSASSTSSDRPSAVLPIVGPPRGLLVWVS